VRLVGQGGYLEALVTVKATSDDGHIEAMRLQYEDGAPG
jgi:hypothetical protein